ncbi:hypothetical protein ACFOSC_32790 [Streptantibioticus rubrisoli]|uniref:Uncharacterized protein n=1 Tax=Streptantibioticus rubrisoli TaxID=1387313 RepID=A0ABT1P8N9_9ACTN|nr:hypothetical protein [Streptantibioticus rubrisoli]MCQ4041705.1 hypothetical protein [Streptantibioticus rubrisoli]
MHTYDTFSRGPYQSQIPPMRSPHDSLAGSATPIYDALYSEYRRMFRALPGDRTGEEELQFNSSGPWPQHEQRAITQSYGRYRPAALPPGQSNPSGAVAPYDNRMHGR